MLNVDNLLYFFKKLTFIIKSCIIILLEIYITVKKIVSSNYNQKIKKLRLKNV